MKRWVELCQVLVVLCGVSATPACPPPDCLYVFITRMKFEQTSDTTEAAIPIRAHFGLSCDRFGLNCDRFGLNCIKVWVTYESTSHNRVLATICRGNHSIEQIMSIKPRVVAENIREESRHCAWVPHVVKARVEVVKNLCHVLTCVYLGIAC